MKRKKTFTIRVSRWLNLLIFLIGILFLMVGVDLAFLHNIFDANVGSDKPLFFWLFNVIAIGLGSLIFINQGFYLLFPPVMMRISSNEISFGTGLRYKQTSIPLEYLESIAVYQKQSFIEIGGKRRVVEGGVELRFARSTNIPAALTTSAGISYSDYCLRLSKAYMNRSLQKTVATIKHFIR